MQRTIQISLSAALDDDIYHTPWEPVDGQPVVTREALEPHESPKPVSNIGYIIAVERITEVRRHAIRSTLLGALEGIEFRGYSLVPAATLQPISSLLASSSLLVYILGHQVGVGDLHLGPSGLPLLRRPGS